MNSQYSPKNQNYKIGVGPRCTWKRDVACVPVQVLITSAFGVDARIKYTLHGLSKLTNFSRVIAAALSIPATRSMSKSTEVSYTMAFKTLDKKTQEAINQVFWGGHLTGPPSRIHLHLHYRYPASA
ncbi:hypothetical protein AVEN_241036-1 [Araneus ventricosus]|uniref:Uncharacterized protein n=1 Tax=Araneus ventricosus TaxID=182803 RepID=A0A4Y2IA59_ARAVE|nr:hypothetical protein AVEN_241036-1 [Araneus ventricosus]